MLQKGGRVEEWRSLIPPQVQLNLDETLTHVMPCICVVVNLALLLYNAVITRHSLPQQRLEVVYGSQENAGCTGLYMDRNNTCNGTSVLNDGIIPDLDGVRNTSNSIWASQLFTMSGTHGIIRLSFEVDNENHDSMELAVFNCPEMRISLSSVNVYFDSSFRRDRNNTTLGTFIMESQLMATSCDHLLLFCVKYNTTQPPTRFINLEIANDGSADHVFLGEVTFLNGSGVP